MPVELTPEQRKAIAEAVHAGNKIYAIKLCRESTGMGLAEAKDYVEKLAAGEQERSQEFRTQTKRKGCFGVVVLGGVGFITLVLFVGRMLAH